LGDGHPPLMEDNRYYAINPTSKAFLESLEGWPAPTLICPLLGLKVFADQGAELNFELPHKTPLAWIVPAQGIERELKAASMRQATLEWVQANPLSPEGPHTDAPLTLIAEGSVSQTRQALGVEFKERPYGQMALSVPIQSTLSHHHIAHQWFLQTAEGSEVLALLPVANATPHHLSLIWSLSHAKALRLQELDPQALAQEVSQSSGHRLGELEVLGAPQVWPLSWGEAQRWSGHFNAKQAWALLGDAAHRIHPLAGMGLNTGLGDAQCLIRLLQDRQDHAFWRGLNDRHLLRRYERERKNALRHVALACDGLQRLFAHPSPALASFRNWGFASLERWSAMKNFLIERASSDQNPFE
jgi:ubiquinone biosynthesis UbiH/UbiF/VisC/COQ6 family hydroxylase